MDSYSRPARRRRPYPALAAALGAAGIIAVTGCSVAAGAIGDNAAVGPPRTGSGARQFAAFPVPAVWIGLHGRVYQPLLKAKSGTTARTLRVKAASEMVVWLSCIGAGDVTITGATLRLNWSLPCGSGSDPQGLNITPPAAAVGREARLLVTVPAGARWEVRVDGIAPAGVTPAPAPLPTR